MFKNALLRVHFLLTFFVKAPLLENDLSLLEELVPSEETEQTKKIRQLLEEAKVATATVASASSPRRSTLSPFRTEEERPEILPVLLKKAEEKLAKNETVEATTVESEEEEEEEEEETETGKA